MSKRYHIAVVGAMARWRRNFSVLERRSFPGHQFVLQFQAFSRKSRLFHGEKNSGAELAPDFLSRN